MRNDTDRTPKHTTRTLLRTILLSGTALLGCMGFLYAVTQTQPSGFDESRHEITITTQFDAPRDAQKSDREPHMDMTYKTHYDEGVWVDKELTVPVDVWITEFSTDFTGESVHNFYLFIKGTHDAWCPNNPTAVYSGGTVSAKRPIVFDPPYGVFVKKGTTLILRALYHEDAGEASHANPSFSVHARYEPAEDSTRSIPVSLYFITPGPCTYTRPVFPVPAHAKDMLYNSAERPFVFPEDGRILKAMAHFHAAYTKGISNTVRLFLNNKEIDAYTTTNVGDDAARNPRLLTDQLVEVHRGDILTMHAIFSNPSATPVPEGMAIIGFYFAPQQQ